MKNIKELSEQEAKEILNFVFPENKLIYFKNISFEPDIIDENTEHVSLGFESIIGIIYNNGQDNCLLNFTNTKVVLWLYKHDYNITKFLELNSYFTEMESNFDEMAHEINILSRGHAGNRNNKEEFTLGYVKDKCKEILNKYYYKNY
ncbi:MAG TPA: hypothetical protein PKD00_00050 [Burkholderiales bacterium]|nr:hypothetical protein [Burkholderiales bacterium]